MLTKLSNWFSFVAIGSTMLFSPLSSQAQKKTPDCKYEYRYVLKFNILKGQYERDWDYVLECYPSNSTISKRPSASSGEAETNRANAAKDVYGPWGNYENLRSAIIKFFCDKFDGKTSEVMPQSEIQKMQEEISKDNVYLSPDSFSEVSVLVAKRLNGFFKKEMFKPEDFRPQVVRGNPKESATGDPVMDDVLRADNNWKISRYIREIYIPAVQRKLSR